MKFALEMVYVDRRGPVPITLENEMCRRMVKSGFNDSCHKRDEEAEEGSKILNVNVYGLQSPYRSPLASLPPPGLTAP
jgi:hypothetical protein